MQVFSVQPNYKNNYIQKPTFKSKAIIDTVRNKNIGSMPLGFIGKIKTIKTNGQEVWVNVIKSKYSDYEIYKLTDDFEKVIGSIEMRFNRYTWRTQNEQDHVFVSELRNFSNPRTPYYKDGLEEYKRVGTRLLQIALQRSYEDSCDGNIQLVAKNRKEVLGFYKNLGFKQPVNITKYENPYRLYLAEEAKSLLLNKYEGL